jgi:hypothetical protein
VFKNPVFLNFALVEGVLQTGSILGNAKLSHKKKHNTKTTAAAKQQ